ncbi:hypothetical protein E2C01_089539 [Portunus trituberculatus]|uniref:Uncharacterized protein n=1 Tax=Portunus trituberculatus TaxID=210409 RepID=A0A5B7JDT5_PORTR|nr:hypothetical protein [Portunus trituberculatus]
MAWQKQATNINTTFWLRGV